MLRDIHISKKSVIALALVAIYLVIAPVLLRFVPVETIILFGIHINIFIVVLLVGILFRLVQLDIEQIMTSKSDPVKPVQPDNDDTNVELVLQPALAKDEDEIEAEIEIEPENEVIEPLLMPPEDFEDYQVILAQHKDAIKTFVNNHKFYVKLDNFTLKKRAKKRCLKIQLLTEENWLSHRQLAVILKRSVKNRILEKLLTKMADNGYLQRSEPVPTSPNQKYKLIETLIILDA